MKYTKSNQWGHVSYIDKRGGSFPEDCVRARVTFPSGAERECEIRGLRHVDTYSDCGRHGSVLSWVPHVVLPYEGAEAFVELDKLDVVPLEGP